MGLAEGTEDEAQRDAASQSVNKSTQRHSEVHKDTGETSTKTKLNKYHASWLRERARHASDRRARPAEESGRTGTARMAEAGLAGAAERPEGPEANQKT